MWISRGNQEEIIKLSLIFTISGLRTIRQKIATFELMCKSPKKYTWQDKRQFFRIPMCKNVWG